MSNKVLRSYTNHHIKPIATVKLPVTYKQESASASFELVDLVQENVLSGDTAEALGLISRLNSVTNEFPEILNTTGLLPGKYSIKLEPGAQGVVHAARRQPQSLKDRIVEKLKEMEANKQITKVEQPTEWVSSMVVSLRNDKLRICIDPSDLNKVIKREHHPMKTVEEVIADIPEAQIFSVLDAKSGFMQIELDDESSLLTTFNTPIGRYRWLR